MRVSRLSIPTGRRPGLRAGVLVVSALLIVGTAVAVSSTVSDHLAQTAIHEAVRATEAIVIGSIDPSVTAAAMLDPNDAQQGSIDGQLTRLVESGRILRIKVWKPDGTIAFSDLAALRGRRFAVDGDLQQALDGTVATDISPGTDAENFFEKGLADRFLSVYLPIRAGGTGAVIGAYEVYEDAAPIEADLAAARSDVLLIVGALAFVLLALLYLAFSAASRRLANQNRQLREQAVTEQLLTTDLRRSEERFRSLVSSSDDVSLIVGADGRVAYESSAAERVLGHRPGNRVGRSALAGIHRDDRVRLRQVFAGLLAMPGTQATIEIRARHADGSWRLVEAVARNLVEDPAVGGVVVNYRDITTRRRLEDELRHQAFHDPLTGLANRALFADRLEHALARRHRGGPGPAVLFLDLDDFKTINDGLGHGPGDRILVAVAERLLGAVRAEDTIARMGGDEFAVLVEDATDANGPVEVAGRLLAALERPFADGRKELFIHASVGAATVTAGRETPEELLRNADAAMYMAKSRGKNRIELFEQGMHAAAVSRLALTADLQRALERGELDVHYQPIVRLSSGEVVGAEALARWKHPDRGMVPPTAFIPVAEETGLIIGLGRWVLETACREAAAWAGPGSDLAPYVSVNVSGRQVAEPSFVDEVRWILDEVGLDPARLVLEFTEGVLMDDTELTSTTLAGLRHLGVRLAIDDFGTGFSSLSYLRRFPIDILKIDRSFVASLSAGPAQRALVRAIVGLGETLQLITIAEGIEDASQVEELERIGAVYGQGYHFARPAPARVIRSILAGVAGPVATRRG